MNMNELELQRMMDLVRWKPLLLNLWDRMNAVTMNVLPKVINVLKRLPAAILQTYFIATNRQIDTYKAIWLFPWTNEDSIRRLFILFCRGNATDDCWRNIKSKDGGRKKSMNFFTASPLCMFMDSHNTASYLFSLSHYIFLWPSSSPW